MNNLLRGTNSTGGPQSLVSKNQGFLGQDKLFPPQRNHPGALCGNATRPATKQNAWQRLGGGSEVMTIAPFLEEFRASAIPDALASANVEWVKGVEAVEIMVEPAAAALGGHSMQFATEPVKKLYRLYSHMDVGTWVALGTTLEGDRGEVPYAKRHKNGVGSSVLPTPNRISGDYQRLIRGGEA